MSKNASCLLGLAAELHHVILATGPRSGLLNLEFGIYFEGRWERVRQNNRYNLSSCYSFSFALHEFVTSGVMIPVSLQE